MHQNRLVAGLSLNLLMELIAIFQVLWLDFVIIFIHRNMVEETVKNTINKETKKNLKIKRY